MVYDKCVFEAARLVSPGFPIHHTMEGFDLIEVIILKERVYSLREYQSVAGLLNAILPLLVVVCLAIALTLVVPFPSQ